MAISAIRRIYEYEPAYPIEMSAGSIEKQNTAWTKVILEFERIYRLINSEFSFFKDMINDLVQWVTDAYADMDKRLNKLDLPIGTIVAYSGDVSYIPDGWHLCDGTGGTPDLRNQFLMGAGVNAKGDFVSAGLPNITGYLSTRSTGKVYDFDEGALKMEFMQPGAGILDEHNVDSDVVYLAPVAKDGYNDFSFDASRSNPIYGNSTTVQPASYVVYYIMRVS